MENNNLETKQLFELVNCEYKPFNPHVTLRDIEELVSSKSIEFILNNYNHFNVNWKNNSEDTRAQVPSILRRSNFWLSYFNGIEQITERFIGTDKLAFDTEEWAKDENWLKLDFELLLKSVKDVLEAIFKNLDGYPKFKDLFDEMLKEAMKEMLTIDAMKKILGDDIENMVHDIVQSLVDSYFESEDFETRMKDICCTGKACGCDSVSELTMTYKAGSNGTGDDVIETCSDEDSYTIKNNSFAPQTDYVFVNWKDLNGIVYSSGTTILPVEDMTFTAQWRKIVKLWKEDSNTCVGYDNYAVEHLYIDGVKSSQSRQGRLIESNSASCGYVEINSDNYLLCIKNGLVSTAKVKATYYPVDANITGAPSTSSTVTVDPDSRFSGLTREQQDLDAVTNDTFQDIDGTCISATPSLGECNVKIEILSGLLGHISMDSLLYSGGYVDEYGCVGRIYVRLLKPYEAPPTPDIPPVEPDKEEWKEVSGYECVGTTKYKRLELYRNDVATGQTKAGDKIEEKSVDCGWKEDTVQYTLIYSGNGGTGNEVSEVYDKGSTVTVKDNMFTKTNYTFQNWNIKADGGGTTRNPKETFVINDDVTLYALWKKNEATLHTYTITNDANSHISLLQVISPVDNMTHTVKPGESKSWKSAATSLIFKVSGTGLWKETSIEGPDSVSLPWNAGYTNGSGATKYGDYMWTITSFIYETKPSVNGETRITEVTLNANDPSVTITEMNNSVRSGLSTTNMRITPDALHPAGCFVLADTVDGSIIGDVTKGSAFLGTLNPSIADGNAEEGLYVNTNPNTPDSEITVTYTITVDAEYGTGGATKVISLIKEAKS